MKTLWFVFIAIFVASFAVLVWVGTEIFRQAPPIPRKSSPLTERFWSPAR
jgi:nitric oxide reductase subunit B